MASVRLHEERAIRESPQDLQPHTLPVAETGSSTDGRGSARVHWVVWKGSSAYFAGEFGRVKMRLNLGFEFFIWILLRELWRQLYSGLGVL